MATILSKEKEQKVVTGQRIVYICGKTKIILIIHNYIFYEY
jgi:hypothetical protein